VFEKGANVRILIALASLVAGAVTDLALQFALHILRVLFLVVVVLFAHVLLELAPMRRFLSFAATPPHGTTPLAPVRTAGPIVVFILVILIATVLAQLF